MSKVIEIVSQKFFNQPINGSTFASDTSNYTENLVGNVGEKIKAEIQLKMYWESSTDSSLDWTISLISGTTYTIYTPYNDFIKDGFKVDDVIYFDNNLADGVFVDSTTATWIGTITSITSNNITFTLNSGSVTTGANNDCMIISYLGANALEAGKYRFNLIENSEPFNNISKVSDNAMQWYGTGFFTPGGTITWNTSGQLKDWKTGSLTSSISTTNGVSTLTINHEFIITPTILANQRTDIENRVSPEYLQGSNSLKYVFEIEISPSLTNTESVTALFDTTQGFVGWYDENFNGLENVYTLESVSYEDTVSTDAVERLQRDNKTTVTIEISTTGTAFVNGDNFILYLERVASNSAEYTDTLTDYEDNFIYDSVLNTINAAVTSAGNWTNVSGVISGSNLIITADYEYTTNQKLSIEAGASYFLRVTHQVAGENSDVSTRSMLIVDLNQYLISEYAEDLITFNTFNYLRHNQEIGVDTGETTLTAWNEDGILVDFEFQLDKSLNSVLDVITFKLVADDGSNYFDLDSIELDVSESIISGGVQQIDVDSTRGYKLPEGDQFDAVRIYYDSTSGTDDIYKGYIGFKIRWETWIENLGVDSVFYDSAEENNNLNFKSSNYSGLNSYNIKVIAVTETTGEDAQGRTKNGLDTYKGGNITVYDYDETDNAIITAATITLIDPDSGNEVPTIFKNKDTKLRIDYTVNTINSSSVYGINRIQTSGGTGQQIEEFSSINTNLSNGILKPLEGETELKLSDVSGDIRAECLIDYTKIDDNIQYNLSGALRTISDCTYIHTEFDGVNEYITVSDDATLDFQRTDPFSISAWVRFDNLTGSASIINKTDPTLGSRGYILERTTNNFRFQLRNQSGDSLIVSCSTALSTATWYNILVTYDGSSAVAGTEFYIDGVIAGKVTGTDSLSATTLNNYPLVIGANSNFLQPLDGDIDKVIIYNAELTSTDATTIYNYGRVSGLIGIGNEVSQWEMDELDPVDAIGSNDGTSVNMDASNIICES